MLAGPVLAACILAASHAYSVPADVLVAIRVVEGGTSGREHFNANGTADLGGWQINEGGLPRLARAWGISIEDARARVRDDDCVNALTAGFVLREKINRCGALECGIGLYNSADPDRAAKYRGRVAAALLLVHRWQAGQ